MPSSLPTLSPHPPSGPRPSIQSSANLLPDIGGQDAAAQGPPATADSCLQDAGVSLVHREKFLSHLASHGLDLDKLLSWNANALKNLLVEIFPSANDLKIGDLQEKVQRALSSLEQERAPPSPPAKPPQTPEEWDHWFVRGNVDIASGIQSIHGSSAIWEDIFTNADHLLSFQREEEEEQWQQTKAVLEHNVLSNLSELTGSEEAASLTSTGSARSRDPASFSTILRQQAARVNALNRQSTGFTPPPPPILEIPFKSNSWRRKGPQPPADGAAAAAAAEEPLHLELRTPKSKPTRRHRRHHAEQRPPLKGCVDYAQMLSQQQREIQFNDKMFKSYTKRVDELLEEQKLIIRDVQENPFSMAVGVIRDKRERDLKRKLLSNLNALPSSAPTPEPEITDDVDVSHELNSIVEALDANGDGLLSFEELRALTDNDPYMKARLQTLKINMALSPANKMRGGTKLRRAFMKIRVQNLRKKAGASGSDYLDLDKLVEIMKHNPEAMRAFEKAGIHLDRMHLEEGLEAAQKQRQSAVLA
jgi:hypothetical protein|eukprot:CAMPEP_0174301068 /NCGR_PEP_ID=MMETSP0809-20121228/58829_1 /TAXON_ID=73025 ORGANISM="Eutreptiella gymnastica-like, Strain CCMP1594" /NCGR_SAMPLE_ID=MMETSP0809 /ASSEMBLY_ACC=CAM_ASM_000658 /LENGTH=531 /DNA_ID=CAMNT_0015406751 /DNA_START=48 /DNA_END=1643 /DNA_ORIENTATION=-